MDTSILEGRVEGRSRGSRITMRLQYGRPLTWLSEVVQTEFRWKGDSKPNKAFEENGKISQKLNERLIKGDEEFQNKIA